MLRLKALVLIFLALVLSFSSCSGLPKTVGGGGGGTAILSLTAVANTPPATPSILSFQVTVTGITLTPSTGASVSLTLNPAPTVELMRLQSDSALIGSFTAVPAGTYTNVVVALANPKITFLNNTAGTVSGCLSGAVCTTSPAAAGSATISSAPFPLTLSASGKQGLSVLFNLSNAVSITGGNISVNLSNATPSTSVLSAITLPRTGSVLASGQLDLIEDFTGVVTAISGSAVTVKSATRGTLLVNSTTTTNFDQNPDPSNPTCTTLAFSCVALNQVASIDAVVNSDGTSSLQEFEPLLTAPADLVEGTVVSINSGNLTQFEIVTSEKVQAAAGSMIGGLNVGDLLVVNIPSPNPFVVDKKGLAIPPASLAFIQGQTNTTSLRLGQTVAVHLISFAAAIGATPASASADSLILRWSRLTATAAAPISASPFSVTGLPAYFNLAAATLVGAELFTGTPGTDGVSNLDGISDGTGLTAGAPVAIRALFIENGTNSATPAFFAAKVRKP